MALEEKRTTILKKFLNEAIKKWEVSEFLERQLARAGFVKCDIMRTPLGTRILIYAERPAQVIGRRGANIRQLAEILEKKFGIENPQIDVVAVENPELCAKIMAQRIARAMARGIKFRRAAFIALRQIMGAGARGAEITISGKLTSERARFEKYTVGTMIKCGQDAREKVDKAVVYCLLKPGVYGIEVKILPPVKLEDEIKIKKPEEVKPEEIEAVAATAKSR